MYCVGYTLHPIYLSIKYPCGLHFGHVESAGDITRDKLGTEWIQEHLIMLTKSLKSLLWMAARLVHVKLIMTRCTLIHKGGGCRRSVLRSYVENAQSRNSLSQEDPKYTGHIFEKYTGV